MQLAAEHSVSAPGYAQLVRLMPSQWPAHAPLPLQLVRGVVTATQVPRLDAVRHDSHCPVQAALQHTPSAEQVRLAHSLLVEHSSPFGLATQLPLSQTGALPAQPPQHSSSGMHESSHGFSPGGQLSAQAEPSASQPNSQLTLSDGVHPPSPSQTAAVSAVSSLQDASVPHDVVASGKTQVVALTPSQKPAQGPLPSQGVRGVVTATQRPRASLLKHDSH